MLERLVLPYPPKQSLGLNQVPRVGLAILTWVLGTSGAIKLRASGALKFACHFYTETEGVRVGGFGSRAGSKITFVLPAKATVTAL